ncbi:MAG: site-specific recombinase [Lactococcus sp.]|uniref:site-specific recombinase n=1 Tax=Pseudolactococcus carnosus TaxID=2749961 RepID=UPI001FBAAA04|nr:MULTISPECIES: site-specific recombinase [Lactococcus]MDN5409391.1 site-specific recombinase [Lactococcus sp.]MDN5412363.1 site-specific recombinase [Lactococcus sp.]MDN5436296.1 site-specific recombinase [Lactococcus sp.]MDN5462054.1 site-specific recombinase [Lactococcus sp.]MDN5465321.1 site-specific recombinase [Lactococcus sp.]
MNKVKDYEHVADKIDDLRKNRQTFLVEEVSLSGENEQIKNLIGFIHKNKFRTLEHHDRLVRKMVENAIVYEDHFVIAFKSVIEMKI